MSDYVISLTSAASTAPVRVLSVRLVTTWKGSWFADLDIDPDSAPVTSADVPSGKVTITIATPAAPAPIVLTGTVDPDAAGRFVSSVPVRVRGGLGWSQTGTKQAWHSDGGLSSVTVEQSIAGAIGETVNDPAPVILGVDWSLDADQAASTVFGDRDWYVDTSGVTQVGARPSAQPDPSVELLEWEPMHQHGTLSADALVLPGTVLTDPRIDGSFTIRDAVQTWDAKGTRVEIWCNSSAAGRLQSVLTNIVRQLAGIAHLKRFRYRIVTQGSDGRLTLQAVANPDGSPSDAPDVSPLSVAPGMSGLSALYATSSLCTVAFLNGDPAQAFVESFDSANIPMELTLAASSIVHVGPGATVKLAEKASDYAAAPVCGVGDTGIGMMPPLCPIAGVVVTSPTLPPGTTFTGTMTVTQPIVVVMQTGASKVLR